MEYLNLALRWLHILSAMIMVGGIFYLRFAVVPTLEALPPNERETIGASLRRGWAKWVMIAIAVLLVTGIANMILIPAQNSFPEDAKYGMWVGIKLMLALPIFFIVSMINGRSANAAKWREKSRLWLNIAIVLSVIIVCIAGYVRFIKRDPKVKSGDQVNTAAVEFSRSAQAF